ncbi:MULTISPECIES: glycosyltransferase family 4 protein [unclassified Exiguobacterium]|uniref:glycosyltransferase family 4 protein n=1 Tax=unclassified Exiguobacterium TaxID=2644629 RepID=UPI00103BAEC4|nr:MULTISPECIES: glycosyltransferase family 4 protein [unclassified Exiguobacterium]TCI48274.1 glycosyltransferase family 1 protein [Exiguobacterium sp. SH5S32]TCI55160.1 glycosyltransferase family 1 protein [Exiguobacterium sp. SH1S4]TCI74954.1 glycosyltransferase family 1 protein [Exiguobacterium sp. SH1S1]
MKKVVILSNHDAYTYNFRKEIIQKFLDEGYETYIVLPYGPKVEALKELGCKFINVNFERRGKNLFKELTLLKEYYKILKGIQPTAVFSYTIKPNMYGGIVCNLLDIPFIPNVTGLGSVFEKDTLLQKSVLKVYKYIFSKATCVFFQNKNDQLILRSKGVKFLKSKVIPGSGVNTSYFDLIPYPMEEDKTVFLYISRIMKEKGIDQFLEMANYIKIKYPTTSFHVLGFCEEAYESKLREHEDKGIITYHGMQNDVRKFHEISHCLVHPSFYPEGMSNVLLEAASSARPLITTNRNGCKETLDNHESGFLIKEKDTLDLISKVETFLNLNREKQKEMGLNGRKKMVDEFDREIIVEHYIKVLEEIK